MKTSDLTQSSVEETERPMHLSLQVRLLVFGALAVTAFAGPLWTLVNLGSADSHYSHTLVAPLVTAYLLLTERKRIFSTPATKSLGGPVLLFAGLLLGLVSLLALEQLHPVNRLSVQMLALVLLSWGAILWFLGWSVFKRALFPLGFLVLMIPFPTPVVAGLVAALQWGSAEVTHVFFKLSGVPVYREGLVFHLPGLAINIAPECSGIRSTMALFVTGLLASYWFLTRWWSRSLLVGLLFPLAVFKNGLRIATLCLLTIYVDRDFLTGHLHTRGGYVFFLITLGVMGLILFGLILAQKRASRSN